MIKRFGKMKVIELCLEIVSILWSYLQTYVLAALVFTLFFFFYAGIKTNRIPIEFVASVCAALIAAMLGLVLTSLFHKKAKPLTQMIIGDVIEISNERKSKGLVTNERLEVVRVLVRVAPTIVLTVVLS